MSIGRHGDSRVISDEELTESLKAIRAQNADLARVLEDATKNKDIHELYLGKEVELTAEIINALKVILPRTFITAISRKDVFVSRQDLSLLADLLKANDTITALNLSHCDILDIAPLTEALIANKTLSYLSLNDNLLKMDCVDALCKALQQNNSLTSLDLSMNQLSVIGIVKIIGAIKYNQTLTSLNLASCATKKRGNEWTDSLMDMLSSGLRTNLSLSFVDLSGNNLDVTKFENHFGWLTGNANIAHLKLGSLPITIKSYKFFETVCELNPALFIDVLIKDDDYRKAGFGIFQCLHVIASLQALVNTNPYNLDEKKIREISEEIVKMANEIHEFIFVLQEEYGRKFYEHIYTGEDVKRYQEKFVNLLLSASDWLLQNGFGEKGCEIIALIPKDRPEFLMARLKMVTAVYNGNLEPQEPGKTLSENEKLNNRHSAFFETLMTTLTGEDGALVVMDDSLRSLYHRYLLGAVILGADVNTSPDIAPERSFLCLECVILRQLASESAKVETGSSAFFQSHKFDIEIEDIPQINSLEGLDKAEDKIRSAWRALIKNTKTLDENKFVKTVILSKLQYVEKSKNPAMLDDEEWRLVFSALKGFKRLIENCTVIPPKNDTDPLIIYIRDNYPDWDKNGMEVIDKYFSDSLANKREARPPSGKVFEPKHKFEWGEHPTVAEVVDPVLKHVLTSEWFGAMCNEKNTKAIKEIIASGALRRFSERPNQLYLEFKSDKQGYHADDHFHDCVKSVYKHFGFACFRVANRPHTIELLDPLKSWCEALMRAEPVAQSSPSAVVHRKTLN